MKKKRVPFIQHLEHDIEDEDKSWDHIYESLPHIGTIVMFFNGLEKLLDKMLCEMFSDRTDMPGLVVLQNMQYSAKVNLFSRFSDEYHRDCDEIPAIYDRLIEKLREAARQRNIVVHADWESTDDEGYTYSTLRFSDGGMEQEYVQLSPSALESIIDTIMATRQQLGEYWDAKSDMM
jgi:hypothetical protein